MVTRKSSGTVTQTYGIKQEGKLNPQLCPRSPGGSLLEGLVDGGVGVQGGGAAVHELGGVVGRNGAVVPAVRRVGQAGHHRHHLRNPLLEVRYLLLPLMELAWVRERQLEFKKVRSTSDALGDRVCMC